jgi:putative membrane-bound dehydrogenase-like protein
MRSKSGVCSIVLLLLIFLLTAISLAADLPGRPPSGPLSPREELATFRIVKGFKVELAASEPEVVDPVAMAFDEDGRLWVAEMIGYPNGGVATGTITSGRIKLLEDRDRDGVYEKSSVFADGLRLPTSVMPYKGGLLVANAPDLLYFDGPDAGGKAKGKRVLYTGFDLSNIQQLPSNLQWGIDNWVYAMVGGKGGTIKPGEPKPGPPRAGLTLRGRGIRFKPDVPGSLEPTSGGGQFGLTCDDAQHWFTATNSQHLRQIVIPDHYLRRNPYLAVPAVTIDIPDHGPACKVHRISPFETWRVERTTRRKDSADAKRFSATELVPGGFITSACSPLIYTGGLFDQGGHPQCFVCDPANNLIHRDILIDQGSTFLAKRADSDCEFLASTDIHFRPVALTIGPDGAIYVADFYREAIETPLSLPDDIKKKMNLDSIGRGRIWRILPSPPGEVPSGGRKPSEQPRLRKATTVELVNHLAHPNSWYRLTAQRLLIERQDREAIDPLRILSRQRAAAGRIHALWTLDGMGSLDDADIDDALRSGEPDVIVQGLRLAEPRLTRSEALRKPLRGLADGPHPVRIQLALSFGAADMPDHLDVLAALARDTKGDPWLSTAILTSAGKHAPELLELMVRYPIFTERMTAGDLAFLTRLSAIIGAAGKEADLARTFALLDGDRPSGWQVAVLEGIGQGMQQGGRSLKKLWDSPPPELKDTVSKARPFFDRAAVTAADEKRSTDDRIAAVRLLGIGPFAPAAKPLTNLLAPQQPAEIQLAAVRALAAHDHPRVAEVLLAGWYSYGPGLRREAVEALLARPGRVRLLLDAIEKKLVLPSQIESVRIEQLRKHPDPELRQRAAKLLASVIAADRQKVIDEYKPALDLPGDAARGKPIFKKVCSVCHRLENEGFEVGADLLAALKTRTPDSLLIDILDPSREVDPRFLNYVVTTRDGRVLTGTIAVESPSSITLRRAEKSEDTILRSQIEDVQATSKSLMPDELEKQLSRQDVADVIAYLLGVARK